QKKTKQWKRWTDEVIPSMEPLYRKLLRETDSLKRQPPAYKTPACTCGGKVRNIKVKCIMWDAIKDLTIPKCACRPASSQLLARGLFPCAPLEPSLAVQIPVLQLVTKLFLRVAPNISAFSETLEEFLADRNYKLKTKDSLRRRFSNALLWFNYLEDTLETNIDHLIHADSTDSSVTHDHSQESNPPSRTADLHSVNNSDAIIPPTSDPPKRSTSSSSDDHDGDTQNSRTQPSAYLRARCPLCFGGDWSKRTRKQLLDVLLELDACFTQKCKKSSTTDIPRSYPDSSFIDPEDLKQMEEEVSSKRPAKPKRKRDDAATDPAVDHVEPGMRLPTSVLDDCEKTFIAADERRIKASTKYFGDTGLMAILCRHDIPLFIVNMTSAGEKQYYALALIKKVFEHLPDDAKIGVLYDIGCQLHRSCVKWGFLKEFLPRLIFALAVFHAYGHQWACQVLYHPRKCEHFGRTDGEGCERFWSVIKHLIPGLRVSGHHRRLYVLDTQVVHIRRKAFDNLAHWLARKYHLCLKAQKEADEIIANCGHDVETLRRQWEKQVAHQTKPLQREDKVASLTAELQDLRDQEIELLDDSDAEDEQRADVLSKLERATKQLERAEKAVRNKEASLGLDAQAHLQKMKHSKYITVRANCRAVKYRLRARLRQRKYELQRIEKLCRNRILFNHIHHATDDKLSKQINTGVGHRDGSIKNTANTYNKLVSQLEELKRQKKAPPGAILPVRLETQGLFLLDVDDDIWQDLGLDDEEEEDEEADAETEGAEGDAERKTSPKWLSDPNIRDGIVGMLQADRCAEEFIRLEQERRAMQEWFMREWESLECAIEDTDDLDLLYALGLRRTRYIDLCRRWQEAVVTLPSPADLSSDWGPTREEL
ncbi:hypothetical protein SISNIDRAFT_395865, partial [Sistotremastrum niveocremeum HHB9708]